MAAKERAVSTNTTATHAALVQVHINGHEVAGAIGETLLEVAERSGGLLDSQCLAGACGTCMVRVIEGADNLSPPEAIEQILLEASDLLDNKRLSCQARLHGQVRVVSASTP
jgi:adenylate cyclase